VSTQANLAENEMLNHATHRLSVHVSVRLYWAADWYVRQLTV